MRIHHYPERLKLSYQTTHPIDPMRPAAGPYVRCSTRGLIANQAAHTQVPHHRPRRISFIHRAVRHQADQAPDVFRTEQRCRRIGAAHSGAATGEHADQTAHITYASNDALGITAADLSFEDSAHKATNVQLTGDVGDCIISPQ